MLEFRLCDQPLNLNVDLVIIERDPHLLAWSQCTPSTGADSNPPQLLVGSIVGERKSLQFVACKHARTVMLSHNLTNRSAQNTKSPLLVVLKMLI